MTRTGDECGLVQGYDAAHPVCIEIGGVDRAQPHVDVSAGADPSALIHVGAGAERPPVGAAVTAVGVFTPSIVKMLNAYALSSSKSLNESTIVTEPHARNDRVLPRSTVALAEPPLFLSAAKLTR